MRYSHGKMLPPAITIAYALVVIAICRPDGLLFAGFAARYALTLGSVWIMTGLVLLLVRLAQSHRAQTPHSALAIAREFFAGHWRMDRGYSIVSPLLCVVLLLTSYTLYKLFCLPGASFWFGAYLVPADVAVFGDHAWKLTHAVLPSPYVTQAMDVLYHRAFVPMIIGAALCSFAQPGSIFALRYLLSYVLLWVVQGSILAYLMPAAGPSMYTRLHPGRGPYGPLNLLLEQQDVFLRAHGYSGLASAEYQHALVGLFTSPELVIGGGISAMPSMHNALAVLFACAAQRVSPVAGAIFTGYAAVIWIGSIHLGWHFALDGVVACVLTLATWHGVGALLGAPRQKSGRSKPAVASGVAPSLAGLAD